jgi:endonuclease/exonuclease/phosphatase family metal-dependent hydrolase
MAPDRNRPARAQAVRQFTVATYNVHSCVGLDRRCDPHRVAEVINNLDADIVALQEVDSRDRPLDQFEYLAKATGLEPIPGQNIVTHRGSFGNVLMSRWPVTDVKRLDISVDRREPRGVIAAEIAAGAHRLSVVATHLGVSLRERRRQVPPLMELIETVLESRPDGLVLLGDLNEWRRSGGTLTPVAELLRPLPALATFPSWRPILPLDRIFVAGRIRAHSAEAPRSRLARIASDHLPVRAEIEWAGRPAAELERAGSVAMDDERPPHPRSPHGRA